MINNGKYGNEIFIERLFEKLEDMSISTFSKETGIPERTIYGWIRKETTPRMEYLILLAKKFNCSVDYLIGLEDEFGNKIE